MKKRGEKRENMCMSMLKFRLISNFHLLYTQKKRLLRFKEMFLWYKKNFFDL